MENFLKNCLTLAAISGIIFIQGKRKGERKLEDILKLPFEKYWALPSTYDTNRKKIAIENCIESNKYIASLKKDGNMSRLVKVNDQVYFQSRNVSVKTNEFTDKYEYLPHLHDFVNTLPNNTIIIGELYYPGGNSDSVGTILRCKAPTAIKRQEGSYGWVHYYVHDCWMYNSKDLTNTPYYDRIKYVKAIWKKFFKDCEYIECAKYVDTPDAIKELLSYALENDEEGLVLVKKSALVEPNRRTAWKTLKIKKELHTEIDCFTTGRYKEATELYSGTEIENWEYWEDLRTGELKLGKFYQAFRSGSQIVAVTKNFFYGWASSIEFGWYNELGEVESLGYVSGVPDDIKKDIVENNAYYVNKPCTVTAMEWTKDGHLRHPRFKGFRDDLPLEDCLKSKVFG